MNSKIIAIEAATDGACSGNPGPGLPLQAPSVAASIAILSLFIIFEADIKVIGLKKCTLI